MREGYCKHGTYLGGCGADLMCHWCETGEEPPTLLVQLLLRRGDEWEPISGPTRHYPAELSEWGLDQANYGVTYALAVEELTCKH